MASNMRPTRTVWRFARITVSGLFIAAVFGMLQTGAYAETVSAPDRYRATTVNMEPAGLELRIDLLRWSDETTRQAVIAALSDADDALEQLNELPTLGYIWLAKSPVGYALKYAHREQLPDGERVYFVTNKLLGAYTPSPWRTTAFSPDESIGYSVIELELNEAGPGTGTLSIAADVTIDSQNSTVKLLRSADTVSVLESVIKLDRPYQQ